jgi:hypothetical protein
MRFIFRYPSNPVAESSKARLIYRVCKCIQFINPALSHQSMKNDINLSYGHSTNGRGGP